MSDRIDFHIPGYDPYKDADDYYFDIEQAKQYLSFFPEFLTFTKGIWKKKKFEPKTWQSGVLACLFGWRRKDNGLRRYRTVFIYVPRKNGKSELVAGIANVIFHAREENDAEIYIAAKDRGQASTMWKMVEKMNRQNLDLWREVEARQTAKEVRARWDDSKIQAISGDAESAHSYSPSVAIVDELHVLHNDDLIESLRTGMGARLQPLLLYVTTAADEGPNPCNEELNDALAVRDNPALDLEYLPVIYRADKKDDWTAEETWAKANPGYPDVPMKSDLETMCRKAQRSARKRRSFKRLRLNITTPSLVSWINLDDWDKGQMTINEEDYYGEEAFASIDLSSKIDITYLGLFLPGPCVIIPRFYCSELMIRKDPSGHYKEWHDEGLIIEAGEKRVDYQFMRDDFKQFYEDFEIPALGLDPWASSQVSLQFEKDYPNMDVYEFRQTTKEYNEPCNEFEALITEHKLKHDSVVLDWMAGNVKITEDASSRIRPVKPKRGSPLKIDGIQGAVMGVGLSMAPPADDDESIYEDKELIVLGE